MSDHKPSNLPPQAEAAWDFPLFDAIMGRRSRRFGLGMEMASGPFRYKSNKEPVGLDDLETAMLVAAATATTGPILAETELPGGMVKTIGKPYPSAMGSHRARLFFTNDDGVYVINADQAKMTKMREYEDADDREKILGFYDAFVEKLDDGRMDLPPAEPGVWPHNQWVCNRPGSTLFMPVIDVTKDMIKLILNFCDAEAGRYSGEEGGFDAHPGGVAGMGGLDHGAGVGGEAAGAGGGNSEGHLCLGGVQSEDLGAGGGPAEGADHAGRVEGRIGGRSRGGAHPALNVPA